MGDVMGYFWQRRCGPFGGLLKFRFAERAVIFLTADEDG